MRISAWDSFARRDSPDGAFTAIYDRAIEIAMGGPTRGVLKIVEKKSGDALIELSDAGASFVWAGDSSALALPRWTQDRKQELIVVTTSTRRHQFIAGEFRVIELTSFDDGVIEGVDSPVHRPAPIRIICKR